jgi:hypothetical protein
MKAKWLFLVLLITSISLSAPAPASCDQRLDDIQSRIKELEKRETQYTSAINHWKDIQSKLQTGNYLIIPLMLVEGNMVGELPVLRDDFDRGIAAVLLKGREPKSVVGYVDKISRYTREISARAPGEINKYESELEKTKNKLFALLDERARIRESQSPDNKTGACTWQECACQWLANTCTGGAKYGTSKESCKEWGGTYWHDSGHCGKGNCSFSKVCPWPGHYCCK